MKKMMKRLNVVALVLSITISVQLVLPLSLYDVKALDIQNHIVSYKVKENSLGGFKLVSKSLVKDLNCNAYIYEHKKSGAQLIFLDNKSDEKMFSVTFRTPTKDDTGVNHIIEHSVLQGSKKYPVKDPFIQMSNRSLYTFLNAMTGSDYTIYPVSSKNYKDFHNLMSVYLDAVFYPNMLKDKRIFQEEGWRYELNSKEDELKYNGIVYNEMKGNYSSPERILNRGIVQSLFPDTSYKYDAGGYPDNIPDLTYENFLKTYKENYSPSNSYFFLSGNLDITKTLRFIGEEYLNNFHKKKVNTGIKIQKPFKERKVKRSKYSIQKNMPLNNKTYLSSNYVVGTALDNETVLGFSILEKLLAEMPASPLSKSLSEKGFGENVSVEFNFQYLQPVFTITAQNVNENQVEAFQQTIDKTLQDIVEKGLDDNLINSVFNNYRFSNAKAKSDNPLICNILIMRSWLYSGDPTLYLNANSDLLKIKEKANDRYFEKLIKKYLIDNKHASLVILSPVHELEEKKEKEQKNQLSSYKASLSQKKINELVKETKDLKAWQESSDSKESLDTLPSLSREDISTKTEEYTTIEKEENGVKVLHHPTSTNGIDYVALYFDTTKVPQDKLGYIYLLQEMLGKTDTKKYSKEKLSEEMILSSGEISFTINSYVKRGDAEIYYPKMVVNMLSLSKKLPKNFNTLKEIIYNTKLDDKQRLLELIHQMKMKKEMELMSNGLEVAVMRLSGYMSESGRYNNYKYGDLYNFLCGLSRDFESNSDEIIRNVKEVRDLIFNKQDMMASYTGGEYSYKIFDSCFNKFSKALRNDELKSYNYVFGDSKVNEGLIAPSLVQYVAKGGSLKKAGFKGSGKLAVLENILDSEYLWNNIRIKGGAYGAGMLSDNSNIIFYSYMDPNLKETIDIINKIPEYLRNFNVNEEQMTNYVIGTIGKLDNSKEVMKKSMGPAAIGVIADSYYITGTTPLDIQKEREETISTTAEDIRQFAPVVKSILKQGYLCVVGGETKITENKEEFITISDVID